MCPFFIFKDSIYLFMRDTERERQRHRQRERGGEAGSMQGAWCDPRSPGSHPGLKVALNRWATQASPGCSFSYFWVLKVFKSTLWITVHYQILSFANNPSLSMVCLLLNENPIHSILLQNRNFCFNEVQFTDLFLSWIMCLVL